VVRAKAKDPRVAPLVRACVQDLEASISNSKFRDIWDEKELADVRTLL
jgi:hypothetical protein